MTKILTITNQKGGSAKTTTAVNLAAALGELKKRVLVIDLDPQAAASDWFGIRPDGQDIAALFRDKEPLANLIQETRAPGVDLAPSSAKLFPVERILSGEVGAETILCRALAALPFRWDFILMDCPPNLGLLTLNALAASDGVLIPVEASVLALNGLARLLEIVETARERLNPVLGLAGILICRVDGRTRNAGEVVALLRERFKKEVFRAMIRENVKLREAPSFQLPILAYAPTSRGAVDYRAAARELVARTRRGNQ